MGVSHVLIVSDCSSWHFHVTNALNTLPSTGSYSWNGLGLWTAGQFIQKWSVDLPSWMAELKWHKYLWCLHVSSLQVPGRPSLQVKYSVMLISTAPLSWIFFIIHLVTSSGLLQCWWVSLCSFFICFLWNVCDLCVVINVKALLNIGSTVWTLSNVGLRPLLLLRLTSVILWWWNGWRKNPKEESRLDDTIWLERENNRMHVMLTHINFSGTDDKDLHACIWNDAWEFCIHWFGWVRE